MPRWHWHGYSRTRGQQQRTMYCGAWSLKAGLCLRSGGSKWLMHSKLRSGAADATRAMPIVTDDETDGHAWGAIKTLAREHGLSLYDAAYLELALRLQRPLASCDAALIAAAKASGLEVFSA